jgi:RNA 2',3'-cyclic 3'-phosphodiesterase
MLRLFVGIGFPPELKLRLSLLRPGISGAKWVDPGNFHLTLRFIGEIAEDTAADVDGALVRLRARQFPLQLTGTGVFVGGDKPRNLWVGVERSPALVILRDKIEQALVRAGLPSEPRKFTPHVTLARLHNAPLDQLGAFLAASAGFRAELSVEAFSLIASFRTKAGSVYEDQADYPLAP